MSAQLREHDDESSKLRDDADDDEANSLLQSLSLSSSTWDDNKEVAFEAQEKILIIDDESTAVPPFFVEEVMPVYRTEFPDEHSVPGSGQFRRGSLVWRDCRVLAAMAFNVGHCHRAAGPAALCSGRHLAEFYREEYPKWASLVLWFMIELVLIGADIQKVIGSAIAIQIVSHGFLPLWARVLITPLDCFIFLFLENYGVRKLEVVLAVLIATMGLSFAWMFVNTKPSGKELLMGKMVPSTKLPLLKSLLASPKASNFICWGFTSTQITSAMATQWRCS